MSTTAASPERRTGRARRGFTLTEVIVATSLASLVVAALVGTFLFVTRGSLRIGEYAEMDLEARRALEMFARDTRMASDVVAFSAIGVTMRVPTPSGPQNVSYTYVPAENAFVRNLGQPDEATLITGVTTFDMKAYTVLQLEAVNPTFSDVKQLQVELRAERTGPMRALTSNIIVSARYVLRNKVAG